VIIVSEVVSGENGAVNMVEAIPRLLNQQPNLAIILLANKHSDALAVEALRAGAADYLRMPLRSSELLQSVQRAAQRRQRMEEHTRLEVRRNTKSLQQRVSGLEALQRVGQAITASLDLDSVLTAVVEAAVELTGAEEGSLLLLDESSNELYMHAARNFNEDFVRTFRVPVQDSLAGEALRSRQPVLIDEKTPKKIKTSYLVHALMYVPITVRERAIGVLGVDNRQGGRIFTSDHLAMVSALAGYAAAAIENARLYTRTEIERGKYETILTKIKDGVIIVDLDGRLMLINQTARDAFGVGDIPVSGKPVVDIIHSSDLLEILLHDNLADPFRSEVTLEDGRVFNAQVTPIPDVGLALTMQDITHLKELDRIKSDFVSTVSHDLRSPLTAILGYIELIDRVGPVNAQQKEFIRRVEASVQNITALINDLLDLGRIEAGFDARMEIVPLAAIVNYTVESLRPRSVERSQKLVVEVAENLPATLGNPVRLRQMVSNLLGNALKYTQSGGEIRLRMHAEGEQIILQVSDNGPGIPLADQPYIFDKFYRAANVAGNVPGTGLGLAIVKSIVENHQGRIWVDSTPGAGSTFTVVLPTIDADL
jgi:two-component system NtrC family sensor kinase